MIPNDNQRISAAYSYLGHRCIANGDVEAIKYIYSNIYYEKPPLLQTISQMQLCLTPLEIHNDTKGIYGGEFLYYYGMICIGEQSRLIEKDLETARACFDLIKNDVPKTQARLAYIGLLESAQPHGDDDNSARVDTLRRWAGRQDMFSKIALAKIVFEHYLMESPQDDTETSAELPLRAIRLLEAPCKSGHPVALKLYNAILNYMADEEALYTLEGKISFSRVKSSTLLDY